METTRLLLGALAYIVPTFPLAYVWHLVLFRERYAVWHYFGDTPSVPLGFLSILAQGIILSILFYLALTPESAPSSSGMLVLLVGIFHWTIHVVAAMAKDTRLRNAHYFLMETLYLTLQFGVFGVLIGAIYTYT